MCSISFPISSLLSPQVWPFNLEWLPQPSYLVGGSVRDALLGRHPLHLDLDFVMPAGAVETAKAIAHAYKAGFVLLDAERQIARVVFDQATADFAQQVGPNLETDLQRRDFTVNAIAYNPHTDELIDPLQGHADLRRGVLRMIAVDNLKEDPLRLLRAYRQAAQLGFALDDDTQLAIRQLAGLIDQIAPERIQAELNYLFSDSRATSWLVTAWQDGLLNTWFPRTTAENLECLLAVDQVAVVLTENWPEFDAELSRWIREKSLKKQGHAQQLPCSPTAISKFKASGYHRTWLSTAKLASLLAPDPILAEGEMLRLKYSRAETQAVHLILKYLPHIQLAGTGMVGHDTKPGVMDSQVDLERFEPQQPCGQTFLSRQEQYFLFQGVGMAFPALAVLAVASGTPVPVIAPLIERFLDPADPVAHPVSLISGQDLMAQLHLSAGPQIGRLLAAIQLAQAEGKVSTLAEALELAANLVKLGST